jgi:hypothetical protein
MGDPRKKTPMLNVAGIRVAGGTFPARIWGAFMGEALEGEPALKFPAPDPKLIPHGKTVLGADPNATTTSEGPTTTTLIPPITLPSVPRVTFPPGFPSVTRPRNTVPPPQQPGNGPPPRPAGWPEDWAWP